MSRTEAARPLPTPVILLIGLAGAVLVLGGLRAATFIVGPVFLALVLAIVVFPAQEWVTSRGLPTWVSLLTGLVTSALILLGVVGSTIFALAKFATLLPTYQDEAQRRIASLTSRLGDLGIGEAQQKSLASSLDPTKLAHVLANALESLASFATALFFVLTLLYFMVFDSYQYAGILDRLRARNPTMISAVLTFTHSTRVYLVVSTIFGLIVAVLDTIMLELLGVPGAAAWGVLAFVTNYIPNIGFVIGLIPPAGVALLESGPQLMVEVIIGYCVINFILQSLIQPRFVGDAVGLSPTITFISLLFWAWALGAIGALLAVPLSLLVRAALVDAHEDAVWLRPLLTGKNKPPPPPDEEAAETDGADSEPRQPTVAEQRATEPGVTVPEPG